MWPENLLVWASLRASGVPDFCSGWSMQRIIRRRTCFCRCRDAAEYLLRVHLCLAEVPPRMQRATLSSVETSLGGWIPALLRLKITGDGFLDAGEDDIELDPAGQGQAAQAIKPPAIVLALNDSGMTLLRMTITSDSRACTNESSIRSRAILKTAHAIDISSATTATASVRRGLPSAGSLQPEGTKQRP